MKVTDGQEEPERTPVAAPAEPEAAPFAWTPAKRAKLVREYVNSGDLLGAQQAVGAMPSDFNSEVRGNDEFRATVESVRKDARQTLLLRAQSEALSGNDKLLTLFLKEDDDEDDMEQLSDEQLNERLRVIITRFRARLIQEGCSVCEHCGGLKEGGTALATLAAYVDTIPPRPWSRQK
jgi:hypothetical protein